MKEMHITDSLTRNQQLLNELQQDYDYTHGLQPEGFDSSAVADQLSGNVPYISSDDGFLRSVTDWLSGLPWAVWVVLILLIVGVLAYYVLRHWSGGDRRRKVVAVGEVDDIYETDDYETAITRAWNGSQWNEVVRLTYLRTLRLLHEAHRIEWQPYKAPMAYLSECPSEEMRLLTNAFLYVRFGHYDATARQCDECRKWSDEITKTDRHEQE